MSNSPRTYDTPADWRELSPDTLPDSILTAYNAYKSAQRLAAEARATFELAMTTAASLPPGSRLAFGYRFGKLSIAVIPDDKPLARRTPSAPASLADFLRSASLTGTRT